MGNKVNSIKFMIFFMLVFAYLIFTVYTSKSPYMYILLWPSANMICMAIAYLFNIPSIVMGKNRDGKIRIIYLLLNLPWLILTWTMFGIQVLFSKEDFCNNIKGTHIWISRRPLFQDDISKFDIVIDLTCEFFRDKTTQMYICFPNLDGHNLHQLPDMNEIPNNKNILIHCANGHGRSSLFTAIILKKTKIAMSYDDALKKIIESRKDAIPNASQMKWLLSEK